MSNSSSRRRQSGFNPLLAFLLIVIGVVGVVGTLHFTGRVKIDAIDRLFGRNEVQAADAETVAVPTAMRPLKPGHKIEPIDLWNPEKKHFECIFVPKEGLRSHWFTKPDTQIVGRVLSGPKSPGKAFDETDFLPPGSRDGAVALVPEGMTLLPLDGSKIRGLDQLKFGDTFVLLVSEPVDPELFSEAERILKERGGKDIERKLELAALKDMAYQRVLVEKGLMIEPVASGGTGRGSKDLFVAVYPQEVSPVLAALDLEHNVYCVAYSGLAGAEENHPLHIPDEEPPVQRLNWLWESVHQVELINGGERQNVTVPKATASIGR